MLKMLKGDQVVGIREAFKKKGKIYLIFQYFPQNLLNLIETDPEGLKPELIQQIVYKIVKSLKFLHTKNVIHRDIKPENILISHNKSILKLCDFGFARFIPENLKQMTDYVATRWYRSPELLVGEPYHKPSDIFALGCIIGELIDGQPMFPGENQVDQLNLLRKALGQLTPSQQSYLRQNPKFANMQIPKIKKRQPLQQRYLGKIEKNCLSFMRSCLKINSGERITAEDALRHPYLIQLSTKYQDLQNDEQNLLSNGRKTVPKHQPRASVLSIIKDNDESKNIEDSPLIGKKKTENQIETNFKLNYGSVDFTSNKLKHNLANYNSNQILMKKTSQKLFNSHLNDSPSIMQDEKYKKDLKKNMSEEKNLRLNLDVNFNIQLKIKKPTMQIKEGHFPSNQVRRKGLPTESNNNAKSEKNHKLPELKPKGFIMRKKDDLLIGLSRQLEQKNNLTIHGQSKQMTKNLISKKLGLIGQ